MLDQNVRDAYDNARKKAKFRYTANISKGWTGILPSLNGIVKNTDIISEISLGLVEVPLKKIIGTYSHSRSTSFADNFMPLPTRGSEFSSKWCTLYKAHLEEGIRDPIRVYEYLNWYYVIEGNKRVSVLKYVDAVSISAEVRRLLPRKDDSDQTIRIYYEFLHFNRVTNIYNIWFTRDNSFTELLKILEEYNPTLSKFDQDKYKHFQTKVYAPFRLIYHKVGGNRLKITTADALLEYIQIYGTPQEITKKNDKPKIAKFLDELKVISNNETVKVQTEPLKSPKKNVISSITTLVTPKKKLRVAFAYAQTIQSSGWSYAHELGRLHIENLLGGQIETSYIDNVPETHEAYTHIKKLAEEGYDIIFTTRPTFIQPTLKTALEYPHIKFLNCSGTHSYKNVSTYFGRIHEPRFLMGMIAGALTKTNVVGYVAAYPISEVVTGINAFALGAKTVNPYVTIKIAWTHKWDQPKSNRTPEQKILQSGADFISLDELPVPGNLSKKHGLFSIERTKSGEKKITDIHYALPLWHWGVFYEKLLRNILSSTWKMVFDSGTSSANLINFWWGIDSGIVDIFYSVTHVPRETQRLVDFMRKMIMQNEYLPFTGPIYDQQGILRIPEEESASRDQILTMDWLVDVVEGNIPVIDKTSKSKDPLTEMLGIRK